VDTNTIAIGIRSQWNFANTLTAFRAVSVLLAVPLIYFDLHGWTLALVIAAAASDAEGYWARWTHTTTNLGRVFDPLADKLFTNTMLLAYVSAHGSGLLVFLLVCNLGYDIDNTSRRLREIVNACHNKSEMVESTPVTRLSKYKTAVLYMLVIALFYHQWSPVPILWLGQLAVLSIVLVLYSWWLNRRANFWELF